MERGKQQCVGEMGVQVRLQDILIGVERAGRCFQEENLLLQASLQEVVCCCRRRAGEFWSRGEERGGVGRWSHGASLQLLQASLLACRRIVCSECWCVKGVQGRVKI